MLVIKRIILQITALQTSRSQPTETMQVLFGEVTYNIPVAKIIETESFCMVLIWRRQIMMVGNRRIRMSEAILIAALATNALSMLMQ